MFPATIIGGANPYSWKRLKFTPDGALEETDETGELNAFDPQDRTSITQRVIWLAPGCKKDGVLINYWIVG